MPKMEIIELNTGVRHYRRLKYDCSITYRVEGKYLVVRDYYTNKVLQRFDVSKYGSIQFRAID